MPESELTKYLPVYGPLMSQLRSLDPSCQIKLVALLASQPVLMATLAFAASWTHQAVRRIVVSPKSLDAFAEVYTHLYCLLSCMDAAKVVRTVLK